MLIVFLVMLRTVCIDHDATFNRMGKKLHEKFHVM